ncbi:glycosyltransferase [Saccharospirillum salsuginis]|uniref:Glycosyltransferase 2-like domain-containing protein n=1 Tax=Saccharospirillum salsuginis TaxID=418750 RepID=A0A918K4V9_9GAMM|nr:glycosyltransferase [Saccharospirillum salsuginis]GGX49692.1 hypothetical protein GCM10007392_16320 [Saccharospirillum salsuginis]
MMHDDDMEWPLVSIVLPAHNEANSINACLDSIMASDYPRDRFETILVDNSSTDGTPDLARQFPVEVYELPNVNVGAVRNYGAGKANGSILAFLDADCVVDPRWLKKGVETLQNLSVDVVGGGIKLGASPSWVESFWLLECRHGSTRPTELIGCNIFIRKSVFESVGGFNEQITSGEDTDISRKLKASGHSVPVITDLAVVHLGNAKSMTSFIRRQQWHAENYISHWKSSIADPVFYLVLWFTLMVASSFFFIALNQTFTGLAAALAALLPAGILSLKRLKRASTQEFNPVKLALIFSLDVLYLAGRSLGLLRGMIREITKRLL